MLYIQIYSINFYFEEPDVCDIQAMVTEVCL